MKTRVMRRATAGYRWDRLRVSIWFAPLVMTVAAIPLARLMYWVGDRIPNTLLAGSTLVLKVSVTELRAALMGIATTFLATAGVVFTLLTLPLSTVAAQYGSRLLRVFLSDRTTQFVLGMFVATFVYCIAASTTIPTIEAQPYAPQLAVTVGLYWMLATFTSLILLAQHISTMLQASNIQSAPFRVGRCAIERR
jgi:uncharacterized membrane protein